MNDADIRQVLNDALNRRLAGQPDTLIRQELGLHQGRRRVDVAVINGHLDGWEIKSDRDSLARLAGQSEAYSQVLDRAWLVAAPRHLARALDTIPPWWGVVRADATGDGSVLLTQIRRPRLSPTLDAMAVAQLLWRDEAMALLRVRGEATGLSGSARWYVWERLVEVTTLNELRALVRDQLRARQEWPGGQQLS